MKVPTFTERKWVEQFGPELDMDEVIQFIGNYCDPEEVFSKEQLSYWAEQNNFVEDNN